MRVIIYCCLLILTQLSFANQSLSYTDEGSGKPLVLIHAFPTDKQLWIKQRAELKKHFRVITLDLLGFGDAAATTGDAVAMADYADQIKQLLDKLAIQTAIIGGESMGGYIALAFLEKYPAEVSGLILSDTQSIADTEEAKAKREALAIDVLNNGTANLINNFMPKALSANASEQTKLALRKMLEAQHQTGVASALRGMAIRHDTSMVLANATMPILIMTGDADIVIPPQQSERMHALAKNSKLVVIANAGHLANLEQPDSWNQAVEEMFS